MGLVTPWRVVRMMQWPQELVDALAARQLPHTRRIHSKLLAIPGVEVLQLLCFEHHPVGGTHHGVT